MSRCTGGGGRRRYTGAEAAVAYYLKLKTALYDVQALDMEVACNRPSGGSVEVKSEPAGLDDLMALRRVMEALRDTSRPDKWRLWELQRLNLMSSRDAARTYNSALVAAGGDRAACISHTTAQTWRVELDAACEAELRRSGLIRARVDGADDDV